MKPASHCAYVLHGAGDLRLDHARRLEAPGPDDVLLEVRRVGICGSDVHYFEHGRCGAFHPSRPFVLGHEFSGVVVHRGAEAMDGGPAPGTRVAVMPLLYCGHCKYCLRGRVNLCAQSRFIGSARRSPTDGAFGHYVVAPARNCHALPDQLDFGVAALLEPLSVAIHAVGRAGGVEGRKVLVTGGGPIGQLIALMARDGGASRVALSDPLEGPRCFAAAGGIDAALDPADESFAQQVEELTGDGFEVIFEASGAAPAFLSTFELAARGGTVVQVGTLPDSINTPANLIMSRELAVIGSFGFADSFSSALELAASGRLDLASLISRTFHFEALPDAMEVARRKEDVIKVQVEITH